MLRALLYLILITNNKLLFNTGNSAQLYDSLDGRSIFGTRIHRYIQLSLFTFHLKLRILLFSYTPIQNKGFLIKLRLWGYKQTTFILWRENKEHVSEGKKQSEENQGTLLFFSNNCIEVWLILSLTLSSAAQQCDSVIHIKIYIFSFLFFFMWFITGYWIQFFTLYSRTLLIIPLFAQLPVLHSPHPSSWQPHVWILLILDELSHPLLLIKPLDI